jgi:hypothetical protein
MSTLVVTPRPDFVRVSATATLPVVISAARPGGVGPWAATDGLLDGLDVDPRGLRHRASPHRVQRLSDGEVRVELAQAHAVADHWLPFVSGD